MSFNIEMKGGTSVRLTTAGKYCDRDIVVTAAGGGMELPELTNPGMAEDLVYGKEMIGADGNVVTGEFELLPVDFAETAFVPAPTVMERDVNGTKKIYLRSILAGRMGWEATAPIQMETVATQFGDAKPEDVVDGVYFTSAEGLKKSGTLAMLPKGGISSIGIGGNPHRVEYAAYPVLRTETEIPLRIALDEGSIFQTDLPFHKLPDAEPNLIADNIKKGVSIFDIMGTYEETGNDPGGGIISAVASGSYTPTNDVSGKITVEHGLGVVPNFCIWMAENDLSNITDVSAVVVGAMITKPMLHSVSSGISYPVQYFLRGYNVSGVSNGTASYRSEGVFTDTIATIMGNNTYKLKAGWTYRWVCGVIDAFA